MNLPNSKHLTEGEQTNVIENKKNDINGANFCDGFTILRFMVDCKPV